MAGAGGRGGAAVGSSQASSGHRARRLWVLVALVVAGVAMGRLTTMVLSGQGSPAPALPILPTVRTEPQRPDESSEGDVTQVARILHAWDADRAAAYARGDPAALRRLYLPGSRAGARDLRVLRAYVERGLVVRGLRTQVLSLRVRDATVDRLSLRVTDRRVGGRAVVRTGGGADGPTDGQADARALPHDAPSTHVLVLQHRQGRWSMGAVGDR